ncbi:MAG: pyridoxamine 5'-phosphate oxidase [Stellaceae bacterium]
MEDITDPEPLAPFRRWYAKAFASEEDASAMALATTTRDGSPALRFVLLKGCDERGFVFYTNLESRKAEELSANPRAALCFFWKSLRRQVRVEGAVAPVAAAEADAYFATRSRESQLGAWASAQSRPLPDRATLEEAAAASARRFAGHEVIRPPFWSGFRVVPERVEFWQERPARLHDRWLYLREGGSWRRRRLYP